MSMTTGLVAIKGQYIDKLPEIFGFFKLVDTGNDVVLDHWEDAMEVIDKDYRRGDEPLQHRIVWYDQGWTIIEDLSLVLCSDENALTELSRHYQTPVFSLLTQGTGNCWGFFYFDRRKVRSFFNEDGTVTDNSGEPLPAEAGYNINEKAFYDDVHGVARQLGINWNNAQHLTHFVVKELQNSDELDAEIEELVKKQKTGTPPADPKPWWKFW